MLHYVIFGNMKPEMWATYSVIHIQTDFRVGLPLKCFQSIVD